MEPEQLSLPLGNTPHERLNDAFRAGIQRCINVIESAKANKGAVTPELDTVLVDIKKLLATLYA